MHHISFLLGSLCHCSEKPSDLWRWNMQAMLPEVHYTAQLRRGGLLYKTLGMGAGSIEFGHVQAIGRACKKAEEGGIRCEHQKVHIVIATPQ